jgi:hypothetical protein
MKKLELKHLAPYLIHNVDVIYHGDIAKLYGIDINGYAVILFNDGDSLEVNIANIQLILRPESDLVKEIEVNGEKFVPIRKLKTGGTNIDTISTFIDWNGANYVCCDNEGHELIFSAISGFDKMYNGASRQIYAYDLFQKLFEWHFDISGLIGQGLAVDYNLLQK